jgi:hypothetical protein
VLASLLTCAAGGLVTGPAPSRSRGAERLEIDGGLVAQNTRTETNCPYGRFGSSRSREHPSIGVRRQYLRR